MDPVQRRDLEFGKPILIRADVWVGGGALVLAGVRIGSESVMGPGASLRVTRLGLCRDYPVSKRCTSPFAPIWINEMVRRQG